MDAPGAKLSANARCSRTQIPRTGRGMRQGTANQPHGYAGSKRLKQGCLAVITRLNKFCTGPDHLHGAVTTPNHADAFTCIASHRFAEVQTRRPIIDERSNPLCSIRWHTKSRIITGAAVAAPEPVTVDVRADVTPGLLARIRALGGEVLNAQPRYRAVRARLPLDALEVLAEADAVQTIRPAGEATTRQPQSATAHRQPATGLLAGHRRDVRGGGVGEARPKTQGRAWKTRSARPLLRAWWRAASIPPRSPRSGRSCRAAR